jgi:hypothetical protein
VSQQALLRVSKVIREEIFSVVRLRDLEFRVVVVQQPKDLKPRVRKHAFLPKDKQRKVQYRFPQHLRIHIRILARGLLLRIRDDLYELENELKAWRRALQAFPTHKLHSISLSFDVFGPPRRRVATVHRHFIPHWDYYTYDIGVLPRLSGRGRPPVILERFVEWLLEVLKGSCKEHCRLELEGESEVVVTMRESIASWDRARPMREFVEAIARIWEGVHWSPRE